MKKISTLIVIIFIIAAIFLSGCTTEEDKGNTISYAELGKDVEITGSLFTLKSYKDGDVINIKDTVTNVTVVEENGQNYTFVVLGYFIADGDMPLGFVGDKTNDYQTGETVTITSNVKSYNIEGVDMIWLEEWYLVYQYISGELSQPPVSIPIINCTVNNEEKTLTVEDVSLDYVNWDDIYIQNETEMFTPDTFNPNLINVNVAIGDVLDFSQLSDFNEIIFFYMPTGDIIGTFYFT